MKIDKQIKESAERLAVYLAGSNRQNYTVNGGFLVSLGITLDGIKVRATAEPSDKNLKITEWEGYPIQWDISSGNEIRVGWENHNQRDKFYGK